MYGTIAKVTARPDKIEELRALLMTNPEWHDGDIVEVQVR